MIAFIDDHRAALYVGFAGRSIISDLWQGSGQPDYRLGIEA